LSPCARTFFLVRGSGIAFAGWDRLKCGPAPWAAPGPGWRPLPSARWRFGRVCPVGFAERFGRSEDQRMSTTLLGSSGTAVEPGNSSCFVDPHGEELIRRELHGPEQLEALARQLAAASTVAPEGTSG